MLNSDVSLPAIVTPLPVTQENPDLVVSSFMQEVVSFNRTTLYRRAEGTTSGLNSAKGQRHRQVHTHGEKKERSSSQTSVRTFKKY